MNTVTKIALGLFLLLCVPISQVYADTVDTEKYQKQLEKANTAINKNSKNISSYLKRAEAEYNLGMYKESVEDYSTVLQKYPNVSETYFMRGNARFATKDYKGAIDDFSKSLILQGKMEI